MTEDKKSKKLIDLTMQLLEMSEDHERRLIALEQGMAEKPQVIEVQRTPPESIAPATPIKPVKKGLKNPFKSKDGKPWYTSVGYWMAIFAFIAMCYLIYLFLKSQHFVIPRFHF